MILAIIGLVFACIPGALVVGWVLLPIAFVLSIVSLFLKGSRKWMGVVGLIVSVVGTVIGFIVFFAVVTTSFDDAFGSPETAVTEQADDAETDTTSETDSQTAAPVDARKDLVLVETAFGQSSYDPTVWWYVAIFENPNQDYVFANTGIDVEAVDAAGTILDSSSDYRTILSGRSAVSGMFFSVGGGQIANIDVRGPAATEATRSPASETGSFQITEVVPTTDDYSTSVHGKVTSSFSADQELVQIVVVARDGTGKIIGAESGYIDRLPTGGTAQFEVNFFDPLPGDTQYEAYAIL
ncbi:MULTISPECIES: hypothetical protein [Microbacterium]|uniref:hypothetical protein n=1 Tax=Microbacterium TaxID=33882 RepID=UPI00217D8C59|nr:MULTISPECIES: hypothetical protein [Microbacterium]UWF77602.1 hypothetical protein JSY13_00460 [Microbacterium neungamense]WCM55773.1 hypothetical protein JRG78_00475 [Microbacterium sp. EF45047]